MDIEFIRDYSLARTSFCNAVIRAGGTVDSYCNPHAVGIESEKLTLDIGWLGPANAEAVLISISGTHGLEAPAGSVAQRTLLQNLPTLPESVAMMFVHGSNAYGWSHGSRSNESNVDLNRNMVEFGSALPFNPLYESVLHDLFSPGDITSDPEQQMGSALEYAFEQYGQSQIENAINMGQYTHPDGAYFGGSKLQWSNETLFRELAVRLAATKYAVFIDWHTGLGDFADPAFLCFHPTNSDSMKLAKGLWGDQIVPISEHFEGGESPTYCGLVSTGLEALLKRKSIEFTGAVIEFGTYPMARVEAAVMVDCFLRSQRNTFPNKNETKLRGFVWESFTPEDARWEHRVTEQSWQIYRHTLDRMLEEFEL